MKIKWVGVLFTTFVVSSFCILMYFANTNNSGYFSKVGGVNAKNPPTIIVDAGHGGVDGGASAADGTVEKDINLKIALKLNDMLNAFGIKTLMTRTEDISIHDENAKSIREKKSTDLHNRMKIIEQTPDSIFVSIHQNHFSIPKYKGTQVFYSPNTIESKILADEIQTTVATMLQPDNTRKIKKSGTEIFLLYYAKTPAIMVECGFLSNASDTAKLKDEEYQNQMAFSILCGILRYIGYGGEINGTEV